MSTAAPAVGARPTMAEVAAYADDQIFSAAQALWPGVASEYGALVPSLTGYVRRLLIGERVVYAKTSLLGIPLAEVLRGAAGTWQQVRSAQNAYVRTPRGLLEREAAQLAVLYRGRWPQVAPVLDYHRGVLFTKAVAGPCLADVLLHAPQDAGALMSEAMDRLDGLRELH